MKKEILITLISIFALSACISDDNIQKEDQNNKEVEKIDIFTINIDPKNFENNTQYLKEYAHESNKSLEESSKILKDNLEKILIQLAEKHKLDKQEILSNDTLNQSREILKLDNNLMKSEKGLYNQYEKDLHAIEVEYSKKIEQEIKKIDDKNLEIYKNEQELLQVEK
jgi:hypothetical protein